MLLVKLQSGKHTFDDNKCILCSVFVRLVKLGRVFWVIFTGHTEVEPLLQMTIHFI